MADVIEGKYDWSAIARKRLERQAQFFSDRSMAEGVAAVYRQVLEANGTEMVNKGQNCIYLVAMTVFCKGIAISNLPRQMKFLILHLYLMLTQYF